MQTLGIDGRHPLWLHPAMLQGLLGRAAYVPIGPSRERQWGHPPGRRNRQPGVSARSKAKKAARERAEAETKLARFWESEWRSGHEAVRPPWLHAGSKRWLH